MHRLAPPLLVAALVGALAMGPAVSTGPGPEVVAAGVVTLHGAGHARLRVEAEVILDGVEASPRDADPLAVIITGTARPYVYFQDPGRNYSQPSTTHHHMAPGTYHLYVLGELAAPTLLHFRTTGASSVALEPWAGTAARMQGLGLPVQNAEVQRATIDARAGDAVVVTERWSMVTLGATAEASVHAITSGAEGDCRRATTSSIGGVGISSRGSEATVFVPSFPANQASVVFAVGGGARVRSHDAGVVHFPLAPRDALHDRPPVFWSSLWNETPFLDLPPSLLEATPPEARDAVRNAVCTAAAGPGL